MPNRWAVASGNWSNPATWNNGATLFPPTASDDVYANNQTVTVDRDIIVLTLRNAASASVVAAGGTFDLTNGITVTATTGIFQSTGTLVRIAGSNTATINGSLGSIFGPGIPSIGNALLTSQSANITISGSIIGTGANSSIIIIHSSSAILTITGSVTGGVGASSTPIISPSSGIINILGTISSGGAGSHGIIQNSPGTIRVIGNVFGGGASNGILNSSTGTVTITGSVVAGTSLQGINNSSTGIVNVSGSVIANTGTPGISSTTAGTITAIGPIISSPNAPGISSTSTSATVRVSGPLINQNNINAVYSPRIQWISSSATYYDIQSETFNQDVILYDPAYPITFPPTSSVRSGSLYGATNQLTGSMIVPSPSDVRYGVPVDNTTGSATLTPQDIFDFATQNLTGSNTIGARLQNISTVQTTTATIAAFKGK